MTQPSKPDAQQLAADQLPNRVAKETRPDD
jgi:hypothetical protein